jgi:hypothetical protein
MKLFNLVNNVPSTDIGVAKAYRVKCACPVECEHYSMGSLFHWDSINTMNASYELNDFNDPSFEGTTLISFSLSRIKI